jgi:micrococcal nuclease
VPDIEERDRFGRLLAYVYRDRDGLFVNAELARAGYARPLRIAPDVRHAARFAALARAARRAGRGLWSAC